jgi:prepilin-type processing-associated H-X9-DG protein
MGNANDHSMTKSRKCRWLAIASVVLGAAAVGCGLALLLLMGHGAHLRPTYRGELWNDMWAAPLVRPTAILAAVALLCAWVAGWRAPGIRVAKAGRLLAVAGLLLALWPSAARTAQRLGTRPSIQCLSNVKSLALALDMYLTDYAAFPPSDHWGDATSDYVESATSEYVKSQDVYHCPQARGAFGYAYNDALGGVAADALADPARVPAIFEADAGWNADGGKELLPIFARHGGGDNIGFPDGHAAWYARQKPRGGVRWDSVWPREYEKGSELQWQPVLRRPAK